MTQGYYMDIYIYKKNNLVYIIGNKSAASSDKSNYKVIALITDCLKIFKICLLKMH